MTDWSDHEKTIAAACMAAFKGDVQMTVYPDGETARLIDAVVNYGDVEQVPGIGHGASRSITVEMRNDATLGIAAAEYVKGKTAVMVAENIGETPARKPLTKIVSQDAGMIVYQVR